VTIDHFTVVGVVAWSLNGGEPGVDLVLIETSKLFLCKFLVISMIIALLTQEKQGGSVKTGSTPASLSFGGQAAKHNRRVVHLD